jgi:hypothetical protein
MADTDEVRALKDEIDALKHSTGEHLRCLRPAPRSGERAPPATRPSGKSTWAEDYLARKRASARKAFQEVYGRLPRNR